jgi:hypothetical protein
MGYGFLCRNYGYARPLALAVSRPRLLRAAFGVFLEALRSFFVPQFANVLHRRREVVSVDHPLDAAIPFTPQCAAKYLEFVKLWMVSVYKLWRLYGEAAVPDLAAYVDSIRRLYRDAGSIYRTVHTTTERPRSNPDLRFALIHALDPHLNCIPSLHVIIVLANWKLASDFVRGRGGAAPAPVSRWLEHLRGEALAITETVLFVKQHSVNCIGASLFYLVRRFPGFTEQDARDTVQDLFTDAGARLQSIHEIRSAVLGVFDELGAAYSDNPGRGWRAPILGFIDLYKRRKARVIRRRCAL